MSLSKKLNKAIVCADGFEMSVQANSGAYCNPRVNNAERYTAVEVGFPNQIDELLLEFAEDEGNPTETVYGWVPSQTVSLVIAKHGGIVSGDLPPGIPYLPATKQ